MGYVNGLIDDTPMLANLVTHRTAESVELSTGVRIEIHTASWRALRGYTVVGAILDEVCFWRSEDSSNPDHEIVNALPAGDGDGAQPALLVAISSPYARRGVAWEAYRRHFGQDGNVLVWQAPSRVMNATVPQALVDAALEADEASARAEYLAQWRLDVETFLSRELVDSVTVPGLLSRPPVRGASYSAFVDPSGGASDAMTVAVAHVEHRDGVAVAVLDHLSERRPPFSPEAVTEEFCATLKGYAVQVVVGDRYGGEWPREQFRKHGVAYEPSELVKSDLYRELLPLFTSAGGTPRPSPPRGRILESRTPDGAGRKGQHRPRPERAR